MFKKLFDFSYKRMPKEAIGFYLAYLLFGMVAAFLGAGIYYLIVFR